MSHSNVATKPASPCEEDIIQSRSGHAVGVNTRLLAICISLALLACGLGFFSANGGVHSGPAFDSPADFRDQIVQRTAQELEAARAASSEHAERQASRLIMTMNFRAQEKFAPWMYDYGQSVRIDAKRHIAKSTNYWNPKEAGGSNFGPNDVALVQARYGAVVTTQQHFNNVLGVVQHSARKQYRQDVIRRLASLREEFGVQGAGPGSLESSSRAIPARGTRPSGTVEAGALKNTLLPESYAEVHAWAADYFTILETALRNSEGDTSRTARATGHQDLYRASFLRSIPQLTSSAGTALPESIGSAIAAAQARPAEATSAAALVLTWYVAEMDASPETGVERLNQLFEAHFASLLDHVLRDPKVGLVEGVWADHSQLLKISKATGSRVPT